MRNTTNTIIREWFSLGNYCCQTINGTYNVQFTDNFMEVRDDEGHCIKILSRDRSFNGVSDRDTLSEFLNNK